MRFHKADARRQGSQMLRECSSMGSEGFQANYNALVIDPPDKITHSYYDRGGWLKSGCRP
jgi:hypothetical protein